MNVGDSVWGYYEWGLYWRHGVLVEFHPNPKFRQWCIRWSENNTALSLDWLFATQVRTEDEHAAYTLAR